jgi:uncharacterized membrane protein
MTKSLIIRLLQPAPLFVLLSILLGTAVLAVVPPLRAPDENAHFLRAYGLWHGDIIPLQTDEQGRRGIFLPSHLYAEFRFFDTARENAAQERVSYRRVFSEFRAARIPEGGEVVFVPYGGSEAYSPVAYIPYVIIVALAEAAGASWPAMLYLMRFSGLIVFSLVVGYAIARTPILPWGFFAVGMVPSSLYGRSVISADGAVLASSLVVLALCLRAASGLHAPAIQRAIWLALSALTKPSQVVFVALEGMTRPFGVLARNWLYVSAVVLPPIVLCLAWVFVTGGEIAAWRLYGEPSAREQFEIGWKLRFMLAHPLHFPSVAFTSLDHSGELWRQLIGVLGWLDTRLFPAAYPLLTGLLVLANVDRMQTLPDTRWRIALVAAFTAVSYTFVVFLLFFLTSTPIDADRVHGVQGRYFLVLVPLIAVIAATLIRRTPPRMLAAGAAVLLALLSGLVTIEAVLRKDWS